MNADHHTEPDDYQQAWQAHSSELRLKIYDDLLLKELQRDLRNRQAVPFRSSCGMLVMLPLMVVGYWFYIGPRVHWTWYQDPFYWIVGWLFATSVMNLSNSLAQKSSVPESLLACLKDSLSQVEREIRDARKVWKGFLLVTILSLASMFLLGGTSGLPGMGVFVASMALLYFMVQLGVRFHSKPRRKKLLMLLTSLEDETNSEEAARFTNSESVKKSGALFVVSVFGIAITWIVLAGGLFNSSYHGIARSNGLGGAPLAELVTDLREQKKLVGLAAMVMVDGQVMASAADGERKIGSGVSIELGDRWHLGGITKSISATMIARLVESGQMQWSETVGERFPDASIHDDWKPVTLKQLLTDTAGAPANFSLQVRLKYPAIGPECTRQRQEAVMDVIAEKPDYRPGSRFAYSNVGCTIAGAMAEKVTGMSWEDLVKREVFQPLELSDAGFGPPKSPSATLDQPRGHRVVHGRKFSVNDQADNTTIMGPSGNVHMTLGNLCAFAMEHLRGERGEGKLLPPETYKLLHTPELNHYAYGWIEKQPTYEIPRTLYWHNGSNTMWHALVVFIPEKNMVVAVTSNDGDIDQAQSAAWKIVEASANQFHVEGDTALRKSLPSKAFPKKSPFAAVRWRDSLPEVRIGEQWFHLVSLDGVTVEDILAFSGDTYHERWQMRFEEDLVEVLVRMGHEPKDTVRLVARPLGSSETQTLEDVAMTEENRRAIKAAAAKR